MNAITTEEPRATVHLEGIGDVPALTLDLLPVATVGTRVDVGMYGVVAWPGTTPELVAKRQPSSIVAQRIAATAATRLHTDRVYVVRRTRTAVTVHRADMTTAGHLLGSVALPAPALPEPVRDAPGAAWRHLLEFQPATMAEWHQHHASLMQACRQAHGLPADTGPSLVFAVARTHPRPAIEYLTAFCRVLNDPAALHESAGHRTHPAHRPA